MVSKDYNQISLRLSCEKIMFLNGLNVPKAANAQRRLVSID